VHLGCYWFHPGWVHGRCRNAAEPLQVLTACHRDDTCRKAYVCILACWGAPGPCSRSMWWQQIAGSVAAGFLPVLCSGDEHICSTHVCQVSLTVPGGLAGLQLPCSVVRSHGCCWAKFQAECVWCSAAYVAADSSNVACEVCCPVLQSCVCLGLMC
jgi:hypothetical protein